MNHQIYNSFKELPDWVTSKIMRFRPNDAESWVFQNVPALEDKSIIELMNSGEEGQNQVRKYLRDISGKFLFD